MSPCVESLFRESQYLQHWKRLLRAKAVDIQELSMHAIRRNLNSSARRITNQTYEALVSSGKVIPDVIVPRPDLMHIFNICLVKQRVLCLGCEWMENNTALSEGRSVRRTGHAVVLH